VTALDTLAPAEGLAGQTGQVLFTGTDPFAGPVLATTTTDALTDGWLGEVVSSLRGRERALVALAFDPRGPAVAHRVSPVAVEDAGAAPSAPLAAQHRITARPTPEEYAERVRRALAMIEAGRVQKVVLGRWLEVTSEPALDRETVVRRLLAAQAGRYVFSLPTSADPAGPVLLGASPELLVRRRGDLVECHPLAGSLPRVAEPIEDRQRSLALRDSVKDLDEHAYVVREIVRALEPVCVEVDAPKRPELLATDRLWHLATPIRARLAAGERGPSVLDLGRLLHPTPAVGGVPQAAALDVIDELEGDTRGLLAGAVGWVDARGDGELAVTIRAGLLDGDRLSLFAGAGIVGSSDPAAEVRETRAKLSTMADAIGLEGAR